MNVHVKMISCTQIFLHVFLTMYGGKSWACSPIGSVPVFTICYLGMLQNNHQGLFLVCRMSGMSCICFKFIGSKLRLYSLCHMIWKNSWILHKLTVVLATCGRFPQIEPGQALPLESWTDHFLLRERSLFLWHRGGVNFSQTWKSYMTPPPPSLSK